MTKTPITLFIILLCISIGLYLADSSGWLSPVRSIVEKGTAPVGRFLYQIVQKPHEVVRSSVQFGGQARIDELEKKLRQLSVDYSRLTTLEKENDSLKKQLDLIESLPYARIQAHPIARERSLVIDVGEREGVQVGDSVIFEDVLVGKISEVHAHISTVLMTTDPESAVSVQTPSLTRGVIKGAFGQSMVLENVSQNDELSEGDILVTTGEGEYIQNITVARVGAVDKEPRDIFKQAQVEALFDVNTIDIVYVLSR